jgi:hypothetical protein
MGTSIVVGGSVLYKYSKRKKRGLIDGMRTMTGAWNNLDIIACEGAGLPEMSQAIKEWITAHESMLVHQGSGVWKFPRAIVLHVFASLNDTVSNGRVCRAIPEGDLRVMIHAMSLFTDPVWTITAEARRWGIDNHEEVKLFEQERVKCARAMAQAGYVVLQASTMADMTYAMSIESDRWHMYFTSPSDSVDHEWDPEWMLDRELIQHIAYRETVIIKDKEHRWTTSWTPTRTAVRGWTRSWRIRATKHSASTASCRP